MSCQQTQPSTSVIQTQPLNPRSGMLTTKPLSSISFSYLLAYIYDFCLRKQRHRSTVQKNCKAGQRLCFRYSDRTISIILNSKFQASNCTGQFMSDVVGNPQRPVLSSPSSFFLSAGLSLPSVLQYMVTSIEKKMLHFY